MSLYVKALNAENLCFGVEETYVDKSYDKNIQEQKAFPRIMT